MPKLSEGRLALGGLFVFAFWLFVGLPILYAPHQQGNSWPQTTKQVTEPVAPSISAQQAHAEQDHKKSNDQQSTALESFVRWVGNFFEIKLTDALIAIFTVVLAVKTSGLFRETAGLRSAADQQAIDMKASIAAAQAANQLNREIFVATERPWVTLEHLYPGPLEVTKDFARLQIRVVPKNRGKSPAVGITPRARLVLRRGNKPQRFGAVQTQLIQEANGPTGYTFGASILSQGEILMNPTPQMLGVTREAMNNVVASGGFVEAAIVGIIEYRFMFEQGRHFTPFCLLGVMIPIAEGKTPSIAGLVQFDTEISST